MDLKPGLVHSAGMYLALGWICVGLGAIGAFLPLMPTVPFLLLAAFFFERGSPRLHAWIINHPRFGPPLKDWRQNRVIRWPAKLVATLGLMTSGGYTVFVSSVPDPVKWAVASVCSIAILFILTRRSRPRGVQS